MAPRRKPRDYYGNTAYATAITRACDQAFPLPEHLRRQPIGACKSGRPIMESTDAWFARLTEVQRADLAAWRKKHRWHPHQLRHAVATDIRRKFGLEAAQLTLGHSSAAITDAVYAQRDMQKVAEVIARFG